MITVEDKLKKFSKNIIEEVQKDSEQKLFEFSSRNNESVERERQIVLKEAESIIERMKRKAESEKEQIISKATIEKDYALLIKKNEIFERLIDDIRKMGEGFSSKTEYISFLETCINNGLLSINTSEANILFKEEDLKRYRGKIADFINRNWANKVRTSIFATDAEILGGCIVENKERTKMVDCSMSALIDDSRELIGKILMDNLS